MGKNLTYISVITLAAIVFLAPVWGCSKKAEKTDKDAAETIVEVDTPLGKTSHRMEKGIGQEMYHFKVEGVTEDGESEWKLVGTSGDISNEIITIYELRAEHYDKETIFYLKADKAIYNRKTKNIELFDNIKGNSSDGGEIFANYAIWNSATEEITTDSFVTVKKENMTCTGRGALTKPKLKWVRFNTDVLVDFSEDRRIACDGPFVFDQENSVAIFNTNVKVSDADSDTFTDKMTVYLVQDTNRVDRIVTEGNVKIVHRDIDKLSSGNMMDLSNLSGGSSAPSRN
ncbi:MAG: LPS export ABC transporter periplasmic protein LptC [Candidatus Omnitrophica bacterium]|nr:LPS export ABC transporter periplasmic protein LptC [Candidatus Omnitrophota bacterium]